MGFLDWLSGKQPQPAAPPLPTYHLDERVIERLLDEVQHPPFSVIIAIHLACGKFGDWHPAIEEALVQFFVRLCRRIPKSYWLDKERFVVETRNWEGDRHGYRVNGPSVPLYEVVDAGQCVNDVLWHIIYNDALMEHGLLYELRRQLEENECAVNDVSHSQRRRTRMTPPSHTDMEPNDLCFKYLRNTPFLDVLNTHVPFAIPRKTFASHGIILAPPNHGKTQLLGSLIAGFLSDPNPVGCFVLDPHGDLFANLVSRVDPGRLVTLDPDTSPPPLNFLDFGTSTEAQTLQTFSYLMSSLSGGLSDKQGAIVPYLLKLLRKIDGASLETLRVIVDEKVKDARKSVFWPAIETLPPVDQGFFHTVFYHSSLDITKQSIAWKIYAAMSSDAFRQMFAAKANSINFDQLMAERKVVLVKGARNALGDEGMRVFLQFMVAQYFAAGLRRDHIPSHKRHLCMMLVDEAHTVMDSPIIANILVELRKFACGFIGATQVLHQIADDVKAAVYGATAIKIAGSVSDGDAEALRKEMYCSKEFIRGMKAKELSHADWAFYVQGMTDKAMRVRVPYGTLERMPILHTYKPPPKQRGGTEKPVPPSQPAYASAGVHETSETVTQKPEIASEEKLSDDEQLVIIKSRTLEKFIVSKLGATGRGLDDKVKSIQHLLPPYLIRPAFYVAEMRNMVVHDHLPLENRGKFVNAAKLLEDHFSQEPQSTDDPVKPGKGRL